MKKIILGLVSILAVLSLASCNGSDNNRKTWGDTVTTYDHVHIQIGDTIAHDEVLGYYLYNSDSTCAYVETKNHGAFITGIHNIILYTGSKCPLCR